MKKRTTPILSLITALMLACVFSASAAADVIFESAKLGDVGQPTGICIGGDICGIALGQSFTLGEDAVITAIGVHMGRTSNSDSFFAAIVKLSDTVVDIFGNPLPTWIASVNNEGTFIWDQVGDGVLASAVFSTGQNVLVSADIMVPLTEPLTLSPGIYGIVIGAGALGSDSSSSGYLPDNNVLAGADPSTAFAWWKSMSKWTATVSGPFRMYLMGSLVTVDPLSNSIDELIQTMNDNPPGTDPADMAMTGPNAKSNTGKLKAFMNRLIEAKEFIAQGETDDACAALKSALKRVNGSEGSDGWFQGEVQDSLRTSIEGMIALAGCGI